MMTESDKRIAQLEAAISEHKRAIEKAGEIRTADFASAGRARTKQAADQKLWAVIGE